MTALTLIGLCVVIIVGFATFVVLWPLIRFLLQAVLVLVMLTLFGGRMVGYW